MNGIPYIGVTDFTSCEQVLEALACIPEICNRRLHVGHMMSYKTFHNIPTETGWENVWLRGEKLRAVFQDTPRVFNVLHFADFGNPYLTTSDDLIAACEEAGPYLHGLQLDMIWPQRQLIIDVKRAFPNLEIILQVSRKALEDMKSRNENLSERLNHYESCVDYFLIDWGMGTGKLMDMLVVMDLVEQALEVVPAERIAVAGGLGPNTYHMLKGVFVKSKNISCDAQGQMRSSGKATDPIEMDRVCAYIRGVISLL
jgi:hypothetical protein